jgi:hypothetical protein
MAQHRVEFRQLILGARHSPSTDTAGGLGDFVHILFGVRQEFVQRRIEQADGAPAGLP